MPKGTPARPVGPIDAPNAVRGASTGFTILIFGWILSPLWSVVSVAASGIWLVVAAASAFAIAAGRGNDAGNPPLHGVVAAVGAYLLVLPLLLVFEEGRDITLILVAIAMAVVVGALTGWVRARRRTSPA